MLHALSRNWWALVVRGVLAILFGLATFAWPALTLGVLVIFYGAYALVDGAMAIAAALLGRPAGIPWWALLVEGVFGIAVGVIAFAWPGITLLVLLWVMAARAIVGGVFEFVAALRLRKEIQGEWVLALSGILSVALGVLFFARPIAGLLTLAWVIGVYALVFGVLLVGLGLRLRRHAHLTPKLAR